MCPSSKTRTLLNLKRDEVFRASCRGPAQAISQPLLIVVQIARKNRRADSAEQARTLTLRGAAD